MKKLAIAAILGGTLLLAGCKQHQENPPETNNAAEAPEPVAPPPPPPAPAPKPKPVAAAKPKPLPATPEDQQVLDDADATGMTARVDRSGTDTQAADTNRQQ